MRYRILLTLLLPLGSLAAQELDSAQWARLHAWQAEAGAARLEVGVMQAGAITWYSVLQDTILINQPTELYYEIGSITKPLMGLALHQYLATLPADLETPVSDWLPDTLSWAGRGPDTLRLRHLVTHHSGMPRMPPNLRESFINPFDPFLNYQPTHLFAWMEAWQPEHRPDSVFEYSNLGAGLVTYAALRHSGLTLTDYTQRYLGEPLQVSGIGYDIPDSLVVLPYHSAGYNSVRWHFTETLAGAGALRATPAAMGAILRTLAQPPTPALAAWVHQSTAALATTEIGPIGTFWIHGSLEATGKTFYWHNGQTQGYESYLAWIEGEGTGIVILSNRMAHQITAMGMAWMQEL